MLLCLLTIDSYKIMTRPANVLYFFFFFQAEDGIRDTSVTGVQTCALPICCEPVAVMEVECRSRNDSRCRFLSASPRSEERRVGKECSARGRPTAGRKSWWKCSDRIRAASDEMARIWS